jgi:glutamate 5-kinase
MLRLIYAETPEMLGTLVVKLGSSSVTKADGPDPALLQTALRTALSARLLEWRVVLVSSGAVSSGKAYLDGQGLNTSSRLAAAVGQPLLIRTYGDLPAGQSCTICQILVSQSDLRSAAQMRVVADLLRECLDSGVIPIVNGNDVTDPEGSDNDSVAVGVAVGIGAEKMLLLTDVDGVFQGVPGDSDIHPSLTISELRAVKFSRSGTGRGGMRSKLRAAELASYNGIETIIANARHPEVILSCVRGEPTGTRIPASTAPWSPDRRWIAGIARSYGSLIINHEAEKSIKRGSSLFASGIKRVRGCFRSGDVIEVCTPAGHLIARGGASVSSSLMTLVRAMQSREVGLVMAEIIYQFANPAAPPAPADEESVEHSLRPVVRSALSIVRHNSPKDKRQLAVELLELFPQTAVKCMTDVSRTDDRARLAEFYEYLSSDLSFIDRSRLVTF